MQQPGSNVCDLYMDRIKNINPDICDNCVSAILRHIEIFEHLSLNNAELRDMIHERQCDECKSKDSFSQLLSRLEKIEATLDIIKDHLDIDTKLSRLEKIEATLDIIKDQDHLDIDTRYNFNVY